MGEGDLDRCALLLFRYRAIEHVRFVSIAYLISSFFPAIRTHAYVIQSCPDALASAIRLDRKNLLPSVS